MSKKILWGTIALLGVACLAEGGYIVRSRAVAAAAPAPAPAEEAVHRLDRLESRLRAELDGAGRIDAPVFDRLFDDDFFRLGFDPFREIGKVQKQLALGLAATERKDFDASFQDWVNRRIGVTAMSPKVADEGKDVAVSFRIPGLDADSVNLDVNANRIRLTYGTGKNTTRGNETVQTSESFEKIIPLPENADPSGFEVRKGKDTLTLVFRKTGHPA